MKKMKYPSMDIRKSGSGAHVFRARTPSSNLSPLVLTVPAGTAPDKLKRKDTEVRKPTSYELVLLSAE
ncbi:hypothetical protein DPEC_G00020270 [Dallia pectoralis]|uniref:Uncharacterized protein n=1 Tax=Dallia pectoralis TaxID=75939 RepID=A0ACC2HGI7_DALPE|nr:hypothetical protein DPEC_G00020270 [Dallia pectoralis]